MSPRRLGASGAQGDLGRDAQEFCCARQVASSAAMFGDLDEELVSPVTDGSLEPCRRAAVQDGPIAQQDGLVRDVMEQRVLEDELVACVERRGVPRKDQLASGDGAEARGSVAERGHGVVPEDAPDDRRVLHAPAGPVREGVESCLQHPGERRRYSAVVEVSVVDDPPSVRTVGVDDPVVDQHLDEFLDVERVALRALHDDVDEVGRHLVGLLQDLDDERASLTVGQRAQRDTGGVRAQQLEPPWCIARVGPARGHHEHRCRRQCCEQVPEDVDGVVIGPVDIFEQEHDGCISGESRQQCREVGTAGELESFTGQGVHRLRVAEVEPQPSSEHRHLERFEDASRRGDELGEDHVRGIGVDDLEARGDDIADQRQRNSPAL